MAGKFGKVQGIFSALSGQPLYGYEIHSGVTEFPEEAALTSISPIHEDGEIMAEGSQNTEGKLNVYGTYVHGVFDGDGIAVKIVEALLAKKGKRWRTSRPSTLRNTNVSNMIFLPTASVKTWI